MKLYKKPVETIIDLFKPRWIVLDASPNSRLFSQYFWTKRGAMLALANYINDVWHNETKR
jgi:hypothetical protein